MVRKRITYRFYIDWHDLKEHEFFCALYLVYISQYLFLTPSMPAGKHRMRPLRVRPCLLEPEPWDLQCHLPYLQWHSLYEGDGGLAGQETCYSSMRVMGLDEGGL